VRADSNVSYPLQIANHATLTYRLDSDFSATDVVATD
jgi:hypothetical protein